MNRFTSDDKKRLNGYTVNSTWAAYRSKDGVLWISNEHSELFRIDPFQTGFTEVKMEVKVGDFLEDISGNLWMTTDGKGLIIENTKTGDKKVFLHNPADSFSISSNIGTFLRQRGVVYSSAGSPPNPANGINVGFLIGQQYNYINGAALTDRPGAPLFFTPDVKNLETSANLEVTGIRPIKYFPDWPNYFSPNNDFVFFRLPDVLLMKAEAILRGGTATNAGSYGNTATLIVNAIRTDPSRGASALSSVSLDNIIDERGRELWLEGWRRQDLIRFKKFLQPFQEKNYVSDPKYLIFPIPDEQLAVNPNLNQNPGY
jgi:hypothetical protein